MTVLLIGIFQIVAAILVPWTRETDRITRAQQGALALELIASDLNAIWTTGDDAVLHFENDGADSTLRILRMDGTGHLTAVAYWLSREDPFGGPPRSVPSLFHGELDPAEAWQRLRADDLDWLQNEDVGNFTPGGDLRQAILATNIARFEIGLIETLEDLDTPGSPTATAPATLPALPPNALPYALDLRLVILSAQGARRLAALREGQPEFLNDTEQSIEEAFGQTFSRRLLLPRPRSPEPRL